MEKMVYSNNENYFPFFTSSIMLDNIGVKRERILFANSQFYDRYQKFIL